MLVIIVGAVLCHSHIPLVLNLVVCLICLLAVYELYRVSYLLKNEGLTCISMAAAAAITFAGIPSYQFVASVLLPTAIMLFSVLMRKLGKKRSFVTAEMVCIAATVVLLFQSIPHIRSREYGLYELILALLIGMLTDVAAYFIGRKLGTHKLAPRISPSKTVEGCIGGTFSAVILVLAGCLLLEKVLTIPVDYARLIPYLFIASLVGQFGDLSMSVIKRIRGVKDYGTIFPGHGGILDRFDSQLFIFPFTYLFCTFFGSFFG